MGVTVIINFPTGFYETAIVAGPDVPINVTFTISTDQPPRTQLLFVKTPVGLSRKKRSPRLYTDKQRRAVLSQLAFSVSSSHSHKITSGMKQYEVGQILEFQSGTPVVLEPMLVAPIADIRHDTNLLDYQALGLPITTQSTIADEAAAAYTKLLVELNESITRRADYEIELQTTQKLINEIEKTIDGLTGVLEISPTNQILISAKNDLVAKRLVLAAALVEAAARANQEALVASALQTKANRIAQLVR